MTSILVKALEDIDFTLSQMEDYFHGVDGMKITKMRKVITDALSLYSQSKEGEEIDRLRAALEKIKTEYKIITIHRIAKEVLNNKQRVY